MQQPTIPELGPSTPSRGNALTSWAGRMTMGLWGWRFEGRIPDVAKAVVIVAPHSSNWDFFVGVAAMYALGLRVVFLGKHTLFRWPLGPVMRWLGGVPVDRRAPKGVVEDTVALFREHDRMILALSPEGTRSSVDRWKTGFYHIAHVSGVPVIPISLDWARKVIGLGGAFVTTGDVSSDLEALQSLFTGIDGRAGARGAA